MRVSEASVLEQCHHGFAQDEPPVGHVDEEREPDEKGARRALQETHAARRNFVKHHFHRDGAEPLAYDLVVNTSLLGVDGAMRVLVAAWQGPGLTPAGREH